MAAWAWQLTPKHVCREQAERDRKRREDEAAQRRREELEQQERDRIAAERLEQVPGIVRRRYQMLTLVVRLCPCCGVGGV